LTMNRDRSEARSASAREMPLVRRISLGASLFSGLVCAAVRDAQDPTTTIENQFFDKSGAEIPAAAALVTQVETGVGHVREAATGTR
jgi:hypothetical protein